MRSDNQRSIGNVYPSQKIRPAMSRRYLISPALSNCRLQSRPVANSDGMTAATVLNLHALRHYHLKVARLPIPPYPHTRESTKTGLNLVSSALAREFTDRPVSGKRTIQCRVFFAMNGTMHTMHRNGFATDKFFTRKSLARVLFVRLSSSFR
jgi:hypothetical protein